MKLLVNHQTHYEYSESARNSIQYIKMIPQSSIHQTIHHWNISVPGEKTLQHDSFNNIWMAANQLYEYQQLTIMSQGLVELHDTEIGHFYDGDIPPALFLQSTVSTSCNDEMLDFAKQHVKDLTRDGVIHLSQKILERIPYQSSTTSVYTTAIDAFYGQVGVCQDHSHVLIAMSRALGIPARYVSGYLYDQNLPHLASHAWVEAFLDNQWYCFDVSNHIFTPKNHIYVAIGRDYLDVAPIRGVREAGGVETMMTMVQVLAC